MSSHFLVDKSLLLEARFLGVSLEASRPFAEPGVEPHYGPDRVFQLRHVRLELDIDPLACNLSGKATLDIRPLSSGLGLVSLDLEDMTVHSVVREDGSSLDFRHRDGKLLVRGLSPEGGKIEVTYEGRPRRGLYFTGPTDAEPERRRMAWTQCQDEDGHFVFPCIDHPGVKVPMDIVVRAPQGFTVVSNGRLVAHDALTNAWTWEQREPIPAYLMSVVVGEFDTHEEAWDGIPVQYLVPVGTEQAVHQRVFRKTPRMLALFSEQFGYRYPWPRYAQVVVHDFIFGGMENVAATTLTDLVLTDERAELDWDADDLIAHELAHQWFGDLVTCQDWSQGWLNEGWATYAQHIWKTHDLGDDEAQYALYEQFCEYRNEDGSRYRRPIVSYLFRHPIDLFDRHLYEKGALVLHTLRSELGEKGFWAGVRHYLQQHQHGTAHTRDFQRAIEQATGRNLDRFFQQWVHGAGHPELAVEIEWEDEVITVSAKQTQQGEGVEQVFHFPLRLVLVHGDARREVDLPVRERERTWTIPCPVEPDRIEVDAEFRILALVKIKGPRPLLQESLKADKGVIGRIRAAAALREDGSPQAIASLVEALSNDPFWGVRAEVAKQLSKLGSETARKALLAALHDPHAKARRAIVDSLGEFRHKDVADAMVRIIQQGDPSLNVEGAAGKVLGQIRDPRAVEVCAELLARPSWGEILRARALQGLSMARDPAALQHLLTWTEPDRPDRARAAAASGLGRLSEELEGCRREAVNRLMELALEAPFRIRLAAISALGQAGDPRAMDVLRRIHGHDPDGRVARQAFEALGRIARGRTSDDALRNLRDEVERLREENRKITSRLERIEDRGPEGGGTP
jgi:aminopeptidase N